MKTLYQYVMSLFALCFLVSGLQAHGTKYDKFPDEDFFLYELVLQSKKLRENHYKKAKYLIYEFDSRSEEDPEIRNLKQDEAKKNKVKAGKYHPPFDFNRTGRHIKGLYICASDVHLEKQKYILAECPKTVELARDYYEAALAEKTKVFVSLHESTECRTHCNHFWGKKALKKITLHDGSKIKFLGSKAITHNKKMGLGKTMPQIIETTLHCPHAGKFTHLHFNGWCDETSAPSEKLLLCLLDRIEKLSPDPTIPVAINCRGGAGRTGTISVSLFLRRLVDAELAAGKHIDKIKVNIPEIIYQFRKQRKGILGTPGQLAQVYSCLGSIIIDYRSHP